MSPENQLPSRKENSGKELSNIQKALQFAESIHAADPNCEEYTKGTYQLGPEMSVEIFTNQTVAEIDQSSITYFTQPSEPGQSIGVMEFRKGNGGYLAIRDYPSTGENDTYEEYVLSNSEVLAVLADIKEGIGKQWPEDLVLPDSDAQDDFPVATAETEALFQTVVTRLSAPRVTEPDGQLAPTFERTRQSSWTRGEKTTVELLTRTDGAGAPIVVDLSTSTQIDAAALEILQERAEAIQLQTTIWNNEVTSTETRPPTPSIYFQDENGDTFSLDVHEDYDFPHDSDHGIDL